MFFYTNTNKKSSKRKVSDSLSSDFQRHVYGPEGKRNAKRYFNGLCVAQEKPEKEKVLHFCSWFPRTSSGLVVLDKHD
jgi:hypothetical protein